MYKSTTQVLVHMNMNMNKTKDSSPWHYWTESWCPDLHAPTTPDDTARAAGIDPQTRSPTPVKTKRQQLKAVNFKCCNKILCCHCHVNCALILPLFKSHRHTVEKDHSHSWAFSLNSVKESSRFHIYIIRLVCAFRRPEAAFIKLTDPLPDSLLTTNIWFRV